MKRSIKFIKGNWQYVAIAAALASVTVFEWHRLYMTELEYHVASAVSMKECLLDEQKKLRIEVAELKKPERIFWVAVTKLQMTYPKQEQIILIKKSHRDRWTLNRSWLDSHSATF